MYVVKNQHQNFMHTQQENSMQRSSSMDGIKKKADKAVKIQANLTCRDCGALVSVEKKPSTVQCPKCGMSFTIGKSFKG